MKKLIPDTDVAHCCDKLADELKCGNLISYRSKTRSLHLISDYGHGGEEQAFFCPFCGTKIDIAQPIPDEVISLESPIAPTVDAYRFKLNDKVYHPDYGNGVVCKVNPPSLLYPLIVDFGESEGMSFTIDGRIVAGSPITLKLIDPISSKPFNVGDFVRLENAQSVGVVVIDNGAEPFPLLVNFGDHTRVFTSDGRLYSLARPVLTVIKNPTAVDCPL
jgi:hypothetical protein